jgi:hypothetical protein
MAVSTAKVTARVRQWLLAGHPRLLATLDGHDKSC